MRLTSCFGICVGPEEDGACGLEPYAFPFLPVLESCTSEALTNTAPARILSVDPQPWRVASPEDQLLLSQLRPGCLTPLTWLGEGAYGCVELCRVSVPTLTTAAGNQLDDAPTPQEQFSPQDDQEAFQAYHQAHLAGYHSSQLSQQRHRFTAASDGTSASPASSIQDGTACDGASNQQQSTLDGTGGSRVACATAAAIARSPSAAPTKSPIGLPPPPPAAADSPSPSPNGSMVEVRPGRFSVGRLITLQPQNGGHELPPLLPSTSPACRTPSQAKPAKRAPGRFSAPAAPASLAAAVATARQPNSPFVSSSAALSSPSGAPHIVGVSCSAMSALPPRPRSSHCSSPSVPGPWSSTRSAPSSSPLRLSNELVVAVKRIDYRGAKGNGDPAGGGGCDSPRHRPGGPSRTKLSRMQAIELLQLARCRECPFIVRVFGCVPDEPPPRSSRPSAGQTGAAGTAAGGGGGGATSCRIVMEWAEGGDLGSLIKSLALRRPPCGEDPAQERLLMSEVSARFYMACLLEALTFLHGRNLLHRDVKPANLLLTSDGRAKLGDLGMVCHLDREGCAAGRAGTPNYMAPEVWAYGTSSKYSKGYGAGVDLWSTGVVLHEMLTGHLPAHHPDEYLHSGWRFVPRHPAFSPQLRDLLSRLLVSKPRRRLQSCADVIAHPWFAGFDWRALRNGTMPAPYVPAAHRPRSASTRVPPPQPAPPQHHLASAPRQPSGVLLGCSGVTSNTGSIPVSADLLLMPPVMEEQQTVAGVTSAACDAADESDEAGAATRNSSMAAMGGAVLAGPKQSSADAAFPNAAAACGTASHQGKRSPCPRYAGPRGLSRPASPTPATALTALGPEAAAGNDGRASTGSSVWRSKDGDVDGRTRARHVAPRQLYGVQTSCPAAATPGAVAGASVCGSAFSPPRYCVRPSCAPSLRYDSGDSGQSPAVTPSRCSSTAGDAAGEAADETPVTAAAGAPSLLSAVLASALGPAIRLSQGASHCATTIFQSFNSSVSTGVSTGAVNVEGAGGPDGEEKAADAVAGGRHDSAATVGDNHRRSDGGGCGGRPLSRFSHTSAVARAVGRSCPRLAGVSVCASPSNDAAGEPRRVHATDTLTYPSGCEDVGGSASAGADSNGADLPYAGGECGPCDGDKDGESAAVGIGRIISKPQLPSPCVPSSDVSTSSLAGAVVSVLVDPLSLKGSLNDDSVACPPMSTASRCGPARAQSVRSRAKEHQQQRQPQGQRLLPSVSAPASASSYLAAAVSCLAGCLNPGLAHPDTVPVSTDVGAPHASDGYRREELKVLSSPFAPAAAAAPFAADHGWDGKDGKPAAAATGWGPVVPASVASSCCGTLQRSRGVSSSICSASWPSATLMQQLSSGLFGRLASLQRQKQDCSGYAGGAEADGHRAQSSRTQSRLAEAAALPDSMLSLAARAAVSAAAAAVVGNGRRAKAWPPGRIGTAACQPSAEAKAVTAVAVIGGSAANAAGSIPDLNMDGPVAREGAGVTVPGKRPRVTASGSVCNSGRTDPLEDGNGLAWQAVTASGFDRSSAPEPCESGAVQPPGPCMDSPGIPTSAPPPSITAGGHTLTNLPADLQLSCTDPSPDSAQLSSRPDVTLTDLRALGDQHAAVDPAAVLVVVRRTCPGTAEVQSRGPEVVTALCGLAAHNYSCGGAKVVSRGAGPGAGVGGLCGDDAVVPGGGETLGPDPAGAGASPRHRLQRSFSFGPMRRPEQDCLTQCSQALSKPGATHPAPPSCTCMLATPVAATTGVHHRSLQTVSFSFDRAAPAPTPQDSPASGTPVLRGASKTAAAGVVAAGEAAASIGQDRTAGCAAAAPACRTTADNCTCLELTSGLGNQAEAGRLYGIVGADAPGSDLQRRLADVFAGVLATAGAGDAGVAMQTGGSDTWPVAPLGQGREVLLALVLGVLVAMLLSGVMAARGLSALVWMWGLTS